MKHCLIFVMLLFLTGCGKGLPQPREMGDIALMRTMAVDAGENGGVKVTVSSGEAEPETFSAQRTTVAGACQAVRTQEKGEVFLGHVEQLVLGEGLSVAGGVIPTLKYFSRDEELGLGTRVWLVKGEAAQEVSFPGTAGLKRTAGELLTDLLEDGSGFLPVVGGGYGILREDGLRGWITGGEALGLELLQGHALDDLVELEDGAVKVDSITLTCIPEIEEGQVVGLELDLRLMAHLEESSQEPPNLKGVEEQTEVCIKGWVMEAVNRAQRENLDFMGLCRRAGSSRPESWKLLREQVSKGFSTWDVSVNCTVTVTDRRR